MKDLDYIFGQNYIEQYQSELAIGGGLPERVAYAVKITDSTHDFFGWLCNWDYTPQGRAVWESRRLRLKILKGELPW